MTVHVFISKGRFRSLAELRAFLEPTYTEDGQPVPSLFMREVQLSSYRPDRIEFMHREQAVPVSELLAGASWAAQWVPQLGGDRRADAAICVCGPNVVGRPEASSLEYCGAFEYRVLKPQEVAERQAAVHERAHSDKRLPAVFLLCLFFGLFGAHRFYVGKADSGLLQLLTLGGLIIWWLIDLQTILRGAFTDGQGRPIDLLDGA
jgi:hypothetical protein